MINQIHNENCLITMSKMEDNSIDSIVTDPPYGISFMGKKWDYDVPSVDIWKECLRVLKPGGHLLSFAGTRTQHRMAVNIEDAGFEIRDMIAWIYGNGFPKSLDVSKAIDKAADKGTQQWDGWGTALKPALEPITVARKPLSEKTVAANVLKWGVGCINIDGCRVPLNGDYKSKANGRPSQTGLGDNYDPEQANQADTTGRFPANLIHDGSDEVLEVFPDSDGQKASVTGKEPSANTNNVYGDFNGRPPTQPRGDKGSAARFFYCAKTSKKDRNEGLDEFDSREKYNDFGLKDRMDGGKVTNDRTNNEAAKSKNHHPTVKPTTLMKYLVRLVTPPDGLVYDPFTGSGSTGKAAILEGFRFIGSELEKEYCEIAIKRTNLSKL